MPKKQEENIDGAPANHKLIKLINQANNSRKHRFNPEAKWFQRWNHK